jgi:HK97 family phage major capsid protein
MIVARLGAAMLPNLAGMGGYQLPRKASASAVGWVGEVADVNNSNPVITDQVLFSPHTCGALADYTRRIFLTSPEFEAQLIDDLSISLSVELDRVAIAGQAGGPAGILGNAAVPTVDLSAGLSRGAIASIVEQWGRNNGDAAPLEVTAWVTSPGGRKSLQILDNGAPTNVTGRYVWEGREMLGYQAESTSQVPDAGGVTSLIVGNWADLGIALWSLGADVIINPYRFAGTGFLRVTALMDADVKTRHDKSFVVGTNLATT